MENVSSYPGNGENKRRNNTLIIVVAVLFAALALLAWLYLSTRSRLGNMLEEKEKQRVELQHELDSLITEHNSIKLEYGSLSDSLAGKDSIIQANAIEIRKLLDTQYEFYKVKKKLDKLRGIAQGYLKQMDSLYTVNRELKEENEQIRSSYQKEQQRSTSLQKDKEALTEKVSSAAILKAYKITGLGVRGSGDKERATDKAKRVEKLKVCFTLSENPLLSAGRKDVYVRIARPDKTILARGKGDEYSFSYKGEILQYSIKETVNYQNQSIDLCLYWINRSTKEDMLPGVYVVSVYSDDYEIGQSSFELK
jgi:myosin heavy subunit